MPTTFVLRGEIKLTDLPDQPADFHKLDEVIEDTISPGEDFYITDGALHIDIDTSEASYSAEGKVFEAMNTFLTKHAATGGVFELEDDKFWVFGPTPQACWQAHFDHLQSLAIAADERLGAWLEANPAPDEDETVPDPAPDAYDTARQINRDNY